MANGSIKAWGDPQCGGTNAPNAPTDKGYIKIYSSARAFAALKANGSITAWGDLRNSWSDLENAYTKAKGSKGICI
jgi:hypothetical protein